MKKLLLLFISIFLFIGLNGQDKNKKRNVVNMYGGMSVGGGDAGYNADTPKERIDQIRIINNIIWFIDANGDTCTIGVTQTGGINISSVFVKQLMDTVNVTADARTFVLTDAGKKIHFYNADFQKFTIPTNASVAFPIGTIITFFNAGTGIAKIVPAGGVILQSPADSTCMNTSKQTYQIEQWALNKWHTIGDFKD